MVYIATMVVSAVALVVIAVKKKWIHEKKVMSLVLCFALLGAMSLTSVVNAEPLAKEFTVEGTIKYDGEDVVITGKVTYTHEIYSKLQIDGADKGMYAEGDTVTITAEEKEGQHFTGWTVVKGNVTLADKNSKTTTFVMGTEEVEIKANYEINTYIIEVTSGENGKVSPAGNVSVNYGENQEFKITANTGYHIEKVVVDGEDKGTINTYTFTDVKESHTIDVTFAIDTFTITTKTNTIEVTSGENGKVSPAGSVSVNYGENQEFKITANTGYHIENVEVDGVNKGKIDTYTFDNVKENHSIKATFAINTYTITSTAGANGTITETTTVNYGDSKTFTITPNAHYHIEKVVVDGADKGEITSYTFTDVKESHTIDVTFAIDTFTITTKTNDGGSITGTTTVNYNENTTLNITANTGYGIVDVKVDGTSKGAIKSYEFENVVENHKVEVIFGVTTEETFKNAVLKGGTIELASSFDLHEWDVSLTDATTVINLNGFSVIVNGAGRNLVLKGEAKLCINDGNFGMTIAIYGKGDLELNNVVLPDGIRVSNEGKLTIRDCQTGDASWITIYGGVLKATNFTGRLLYVYNEPIVVLENCAFYFKGNMDDWLDSFGYIATQSKDTNNKDIWVVTEK